MTFDYEETGDGYLVTLAYIEQKTTQKNTRDLILSLLDETPQLTRIDLAESIGISPDEINNNFPN